MLASLSGILFTWSKASKLIEKNLHFLISFSAGVFLVISYNLIIESLHIGNSLSVSVLWVLLGIIGVWSLFKIIPEFHNHNNEHSHKDENCAQKENIQKDNSNKLDPRKIIFSDAIHNIGDGILLATAFTISSVFGILTALGILIHELIQEISEFFILKKSGFSTKNALKINFLTSSTILIGSVGGFLLLGYFELLEVPLLGIAGGAFLVVVLQDLIPHSIKDSISNRHHFKHIFWFIIGALLMFSINSQFTHEHGHSDHEDEHSHEHANEHESEYDHEEDHSHENDNQYEDDHKTDQVDKHTD